MKLLKEIFSSLSLMTITFLFSQTIVNFGNDVWYGTWGVLIVVGCLAAFFDEKVEKIQQQRKANQSKEI